MTFKQAAASDQATDECVSTMKEEPQYVDYDAEELSELKPDLTGDNKMSWCKIENDALPKKTPTASKKVKRNRTPLRSLFDCQHCHRSFDVFFKLEQHMNIHAQDFAPALLCHHCGKKFSAKSVIKNHMAQCMSLKYSHGCTTCGKQFMAKVGLELHTQRIHRKIFRSFFCAECGKSFLCETTLKAHCSTHSKLKLHKCKICSKEFTDASTLRNHLLVHDEKKAFKCEICGKSFKRASYMPYHIRTHSGVQPYPCDECDKSFRFPCLLTNHKIVQHSGDEQKPKFQCDHCKQYFKLRQNILNHLRESRGGPFPCAICSKVFQGMCSLKMHSKTHVSCTFYCALCGAGFTTNPKLQKHMDNLHKQG